MRVASASRASAMTTSSSTMARCCSYATNSSIARRKTTAILSMRRRSSLSSSLSSSSSAATTTTTAALASTSSSSSSSSSSPSFSTARASLSSAGFPRVTRYNNFISSTSSPRRKSAKRASKTTVAVFTGIVQGTAAVASVEKKKGGNAATITLAFPANALSGVIPGGSIAINGTCLTVVTADETKHVATFDVVDETLRATSLGGLVAGSRANFERAARVGDEIGGHLVSGHVCCVAQVVEREEQEDGNVRMKFSLPARWGKYVLPKGFVSLDGCSLTVGPDVEVNSSSSTTSFSVFFIPETLRVTRFGEAAVGDDVNVEVDATTQAVVDAVERAVDARVDARLAELEALRKS